MQEWTAWAHAKMQNLEMNGEWTSRQQTANPGYLEKWTLNGVYMECVSQKKLMLQYKT